MSSALLTGTFDVLHPGHLAIINFALQFDKVLILVDSDERVASLKGPGRPVNTLDVRRKMIYALKGIDYPKVDVLSFGSDSNLQSHLGRFNPDYWIMGSDHTREEIPVKVPARTTLVFFERLPEYSSTKILEAQNALRD